MSQEGARIEQIFPYRFDHHSCVKFCLFVVCKLGRSANSVFIANIAPLYTKTCTKVHYEK